MAYGVGVGIVALALARARARAKAKAGRSDTTVCPPFWQPRSISQRRLVFFDCSFVCA